MAASRFQVQFPKTIARENKPSEMCMWIEKNKKDNKKKIAKGGE